MIPLAFQLELVWFTAVAALLGALIGMERRQAAKPAGLRTQSLVCAASALIVALGRAVNFLADSGDPTRALHAVITGIGFLGAGTILHSKKGFSGVTTAAAVFTTSAIGVTVGLGAPVAALGATLIVLFLLRGIRLVDRGIQRVNSRFHARFAPNLDDDGPEAADESLPA
jgi:putative Mg2+ transporter-C (MgtC) family protein